MSKPIHPLHGSMSFLDPTTLDDTGIASSGLVDPLYVDATGSSTVVAPSISYALYLTEKGDTSAISVNDIHQGYVGDCFLLSTMGEIAIHNPSGISNMIHSNSNGTESVNLYAGASISLSSPKLTPVTETVTNKFESDAVNCGGQTIVGNQEEIWPQVIEQAVAELDGSKPGSLSSIAYGGYPFLTMEQLTGKAASWMAPQSLTLANLTSMVAANDLLVFDTNPTGNLGYGLVNSHAYMFQSVTGSGSTAMCHFENPWGPAYNPAPVPLSAVAHDFNMVNIGHC